MEDLLPRSSEGIKAHLNALRVAQKAMQDRKSEGIGSVRRIARSLLHAASSFKDTSLQKLLSEIENANDDDLGPHLDALLPRLGALSAIEPVHKRMVLLVEDDPLLVRVLEKQLASTHQVFCIAKTLKESELALSQKDISLVLLDLMLPDGDGRDLLLRVRQNPATANIPVIVLSCKVGQDVKTECFALGADAFFEKPYDPIALSTAIAAKLHRAANASSPGSLDPVTHLPNRMVFYRAFAQTAQLASRTQEPLTIAILDLDRFKSINDISGHQMGDRVLQTFASLLMQTLRTSDVIARWGGEEFAVLFPNTDLTQARFALNKALAALRKKTFEAPDKRQFRITFSAGVTPVTPGMSADAAIAEADRYLYLAKALGRNHVLSKEDSVDRLKRNILLVEDDDFMASLLRRFLEKAGFRIFHAKNGEIALALCSEAVFSLITLDVKLPDIDGFKLLERFRENHAVRHVPVIMLTSKGDEEDVIRGFRLGADDYIVKPFSPSQFLARANRLLEK